MAGRNLNIENARITFRNFSGKAGQYNPAGRRNFCVLLDEDIAQRLAADGWTVKYLRPREEGDTPQAYMQVAVSFEVRPPRIVLISGDTKTVLDEDSIDILDWAEIESCDLVINPSHWEVAGRSGLKAYLKSLYVTIVEDEFEAKYRDIPNAPDSAKSSLVHAKDVPF